MRRASSPSCSAQSSLCSWASDPPPHPQCASPGVILDQNNSAVLVMKANTHAHTWGDVGASVDVGVLITLCDPGTTIAGAQGLQHGQLWGVGGDPRIGGKQTKAKMTHLSCFSAPTEHRVDEDSIGPRRQKEPKRLGLGRENSAGRGRTYFSHKPGIQASSIQGGHLSRPTSGILLLFCPPRSSPLPLSEHPRH